MKKVVINTALICIFFLSICFLIYRFCKVKQMKKDYGVFIGTDNIDKIKGYNVVVVEPASIDVSGVEFLHKTNEKVYAYLDIGSLENYRPYFNEFKEKTLGLYENWEDEYWMDVSDIAWQKLIVDKLGRDIVDKGFDGFFIDNCDVYYNYPTEEIFNGLSSILQGLRSLNMTKKYKIDIIINGGDTFVSRCIENKTATELFDGVNQECVFTDIDFENKTYKEKNESDIEYFKEYLANIKKHIPEVYLIEYGANSNLIKEIENYCNENGFHWYNARGLDLK
ncbi:PF03537 domain protein [Lachnoanaerobaculum saburreum F0468]|uniref:PF03537 domain protein n=1 Tax=Lachnoanaerobaculum saburreum F0468 TaxID=1095750 RepID=I0R7Z4_9FIRM|nr:endo alpha-1,4 polygalactosaminidase [Lachnoanaerobaculum saburreum]EIC95802.1 PF03537 domain protein [Lachnoanaerobaculum saburreum F0468]